MSGLPQLNPLQRCNVSARLKSKLLTDMLHGRPHATYIETSFSTSHVRRERHAGFEADDWKEAKASALISQSHSGNKQSIDVFSLHNRSQAQLVHVSVKERQRDRN